MLKREEIMPDTPGYFKKNENRYRYCGDVNTEEGLFRCTREIAHKGPHAAHIVRGSGQPNGADVNVQIATWWYPE